MISFFLFLSVVSNESQLISIENLRAATDYRIQVAARSLAGQGALSPPVKAQTLVGSIPEFSLRNNSCINGTACLIQWVVENNGGSPIIDIQIFFTQVNDLL